MGVFKAYDIRGIYGSEITEEFAYKLGKALIIYFKNKKISINGVVVGYDSRISNLKLFSALSKSFIEEGIDVVHTGLVSRPMLNWIAFSKKYDLGIVISASHNPKEYNGFKFLLKGNPFSYEDGLDEIKKIMNENSDINKIKFEKSIKESKIKKTLKTLKNKFSKSKQGKIISKDYIDEYIDFLSSYLSKEFLIKSKKEKTPIKIVADACNGSAGEIIKKFFEKNEIDGKILFAEPDGTFPCHNPNPLDNNALVVLSRTVVSEKAKFGFIVDPDADRIRFVDEKGKIIDNGYSASLVVKYLLNLKENKNKNSAIVHDLIARKILSETISRNKGIDIISRVGFASITKNMKENNAFFGCESSGHCSFKDFNYLDSAMMMLVNFLNTLYSKENYSKTLSSIVKPLNKYIDLGEINFHLDEKTDKKQLMETIFNYFKKEKSNKKSKLNIKKIMTLDGISVYFKNSWMNVRPSNTEPLLRLRAEGKNIKDLEKIKKLVDKLIK